jgi:glucose-6-phosphate 1-dehydrogenase
MKEKKLDASDDSMAAKFRHLLNLAACVAMDTPSDFSESGLAAAKLKALAQIEPIDTDHLVLGQV